MSHNTEQSFVPREMFRKLRLRCTEIQERMAEMIAVQDGEGCFDLIKKLLTIGGYWKSKEKQKSIPFRYLLPRMILILGSWNILRYPISIYLAMPNPLQIIEHLIMFLMFILSILKIASLLWYDDNYKMLLDVMEEMFARGMQGSEADRQLLTSTLKNSKLITSLYMKMFVPSTMVMNALILPYMWFTRQMYFGGWYPFDEHASPYFEITLVLDAFLLIPGSILLIITYDALMVAIFMQTIGQFKLLQHMLINISETAIKQATVKNLKALQSHNMLDKNTGRRRETMNLVQLTTSLSDDNKTVVPTLKQVNNEMEILMNECINLHMQLTSYVQEIENVYQIIFMSQFVIFLIPTGLMLLYFTLVPEWSALATVLVLPFFSCVIELYIMCYLCDRITEESSLVKDAIFDCDWLESSPSFKQSMRIMMSRANSPLVIKAGGFIQLSIEVFYRVSKLTYSYYTSLVTTMTRE